MGRRDGSSPLARGTLPCRRLCDANRRFIPARAGNTIEFAKHGIPTAVHPRSRGEHENGLMLGAQVVGSSPLARGTRWWPADPARRHRFIPARAGNTHTRPFDRDAALGSSPLARGTRRAAAGLAYSGRFIPARAGNTTGPRPAAPATAVHPRSRGEHPNTKAWVYGVSGSSPLARGTPDALRDWHRQFRFIPARAGNTAGIHRIICNYTVHPRSRGEHTIAVAIIGVATGSSPLARGTHFRILLQPLNWRFIPARAGNTFPHSVTAIKLAVHPRSRGEHAFPAGQPQNPAGSSPLARGTPRWCHTPKCRPRFIPARAGNTARTTGAACRSAVHPRSRGEHIWTHVAVPKHGGSSPLARGTRQGRLARPADQRFIPARAGNTDDGIGALPGIAVHPRSRGEHLDYGVK